MSGEAGAQLESTYYALFIGSGINVSVAPPPGDDGSYIGKYFERKSAPYYAWLDRARPALDALFARLVAAQELPLVALGDEPEQVDGVIIEDLRTDRADDDRHFRKYQAGGPFAVHMSGSGRLPNLQSLELHVSVSARVRRSALDTLVAEVAAVLTAAETP